MTLLEGSGEKRETVELARVLSRTSRWWQAWHLSWTSQSPYQTLLGLVCV